MRQLHLIAHGEPSDVIELNTVSEPALGQEDVLISMEAAPMNPSDFLFVRGNYGVRAEAGPRRRNSIKSRQNH
jgi:NADPH:quinone reductase-like Zn-dependent oxidoreductase